MKNRNAHRWYAKKFKIFIVFFYIFGHFNPHRFKYSFIRSSHFYLVTTCANADFLMMMILDTYHYLLSYKFIQFLFFISLKTNQRLTDMIELMKQRLKPSSIGTLFIEILSSTRILDNYRLLFSLLYSDGADG